jgi:hypothetical protein
MAGHPELMGPDVTMAHLLLKSNVSNVVGCSAYALVTQTAAAQLDVPVSESTAHTESFAHYPPIDTHIFPCRERGRGDARRP